MKRIFPATANKAANNTDDKINNEIREKTINELNLLKDTGVSVLSVEIDRLKDEWDIERVLETSAAFLILLSSILGYRSKKICFYLLSGTVGFYLLQHALQGRCPLLSFYRKRGVRTSEEIANQRIAFKDLRGDFSQNTKDAAELLSRAER